MKIHKRAKQKPFLTDKRHTQQVRSHRNIRWLIIIACCCCAFIGVSGIASAARNSSGNTTTLDQKMQGYQQLVNNARKHPRPKPSTSQAPASKPAPTRQAGITDLGQGPFPRHIFAVNNLWQGPVGNDWLLAYAGSKTNPDETAGTGGIALYTETVNNQGGFDLQPVGTFLAPDGTSALTATAQQGNLLLLHDKTGKEVKFNLLTHQYQ